MSTKKSDALLQTMGPLNLLRVYWKSSLTIFADIIDDFSKYICSSVLEENNPKQNLER